MTCLTRLLVIVLAVVPAWPMLAAQKSAAVPAGQWRSLDLAIRDLADAFHDRYPDAGKYLAELQALRQAQDTLDAATPRDEKEIGRAHV